MDVVIPAKAEIQYSRGARDQFEKLRRAGSSAFAGDDARG